jgi:hypothetical protein
MIIYATDRHDAVLAAHEIADRLNKTVSVFFWSSGKYAVQPYELFDEDLRGFVRNVAPGTEKRP